MSDPKRRAVVRPSLEDDLRAISHVFDAVLGPEKFDPQSIRFFPYIEDVEGKREAADDAIWKGRENERALHVLLRPSVTGSLFGRTPLEDEKEFTTMRIDLEKHQVDHPHSHRLEFRHKDEYGKSPNVLFVDRNPNPGHPTELIPWRSDIDHAGGGRLLDSALRAGLTVAIMTPWPPEHPASRSSGGRVWIFFVKTNVGVYTLPRPRVRLLDEVVEFWEFYDDQSLEQDILCSLRGILMTEYVVHGIQEKRRREVMSKIDPHLKIPDLSHLAAEYDMGVIKGGFRCGVCISS